MKKRFILIFVVLGVAFAIPKIKAYYSSKANEVQTKVDFRNDKKLETSPSSGFGKLLKSSRAGYRTTLEQDANLPKECLDFFDALQKIDFFSKDQVDQLTYQLLPSQPELCKGEFITGFTAVEQDYFKKCKPDGQNLSDKISEECTSAVFMMRAAVTRLALKDMPLSEITDMAQLTDLVFSELTGVFNNEKTGNFQKMKQIAERMLELDPKLFAAHKINVMSNLIEGLMSKDQNSGADVWKQSSEALQKAREIRPNDEVLNDAEVAIQTKGFDPALTHEVAQKMTEQNPNQDRGWFLLAYSQWKQGDRGASIQNLKHAISLAPNNSDYQNTLAEISKPGANADSYKGAFKIGISDDDFNH